MSKWPEVFRDACWVLRLNSQRTLFSRELQHVSFVKHNEWKLHKQLSFGPKKQNKNKCPPPKKSKQTIKAARLQATNCHVKSIFFLFLQDFWGLFLSHTQLPSNQQSPGLCPTSSPVHSFAAPIMDTQKFAQQWAVNWNFGHLKIIAVPHRQLLHKNTTEIKFFFVFHSGICDLTVHAQKSDPQIATVKN